MHDARNSDALYATAHVQPGGHLFVHCVLVWQHTQQEKGVACACVQGSTLGGWREVLGPNCHF